MSANLTGQNINSTYFQLLNVDGGVSASLTTVSGGDGAASALKISTGAASVDNLKFDGNTISSTDTNGNITLSPNGSGAVVATNVTITGGSITGITDVAVADGGTGASTAAGARTNLGLGTMATQDASAVSITGGTISGSYTGITLWTSATLYSTSIMGYTTGAGGTVTQATSKSTGVTLNKASGQITMNNAALNTVTVVSFTLTNSFIATTDVVVVSIDSGATAGAYFVTVDAVGSGTCQISLYNRTGGSLSEAVVLNFVVIKAATS